MNAAVKETERRKTGFSVIQIKRKEGGIMKGDVFMRQAVIVAVLAVATMITRFLPFLIFPAGKKIPDYVDYLGRTLPYAAIGLLVVYCLRNVNFLAAPFGLPEILAVAVIVAIHWWKGNSLLSIGVGTIFYMILVQVLFQ